MSKQTFRRDLDAATRYQELLVPALMEEWAPRVAEAAGIRPGDRVLDVACGTGVLTREVDVRDWLQIVGITLDEGLIEAILQESEAALRPFLTMKGDGVAFDSPAVLATAMR
jgi:16S rRNA A1518/A1519 N6-dimethyltransferase RsmA/KsgA/DIM1 with predicted DNA glycosylase/AP lyase activity